MTGREDQEEGTEEEEEGAEEGAEAGAEEKQEGEEEGEKDGAEEGAEKGEEEGVEEGHHRTTEAEPACWLVLSSSQLYCNNGAAISWRFFFRYFVFVIVNKCC